LMRINEDVVRAQTLRLEEPTTEPSIMMKKSYDDGDKKPYTPKDKKEAA
jgi:ribosomal protein S6